MEGEQPEAAIRVLLAQFLKDPNEPRDPLEDYVPGMLDLLERATEVADALRLPAPLRMELRMKTAGASQFLGELERFMRIAPPALEQLYRESGLADYDQLDPLQPPMERLTEALNRAQQRFDATPAADRGLSPADAIREVACCCAMYAAVAILAFDPELLESLHEHSGCARGCDNGWLALSGVAAASSYRARGEPEHQSLRRQRTSL